MRIAFLAKRSSIHSVRWVNELAARGHDISLITMHRSGDVIDKRVRTYYLPFGPPFGYFLNVVYVRKLLRHIGPDLLHVHFASGYGTLGRLTGFHPMILSVWGSDVYEFPNKSPLYAKILRGNIKSADMICSTSHAMARQTRSVCQAVEEIEITPFGIDMDFFQATEGSRSGGTVTVGTVKTMSHKYGIDVLLKAFAFARRSIRESDKELADRMRLLIVGGGPQLRELVKLSGQLFIQDVTDFVGPMPHEAIPKYLNKMDIYVAASRIESFGVAVLEASACGLPVVVSDAGGLPEVVKDGETGFVAPKEDIEATVRHIISLVENPDLRIQMGAMGREHVQKHYRWEHCADIMEGVYEKLLRKRR